MPGRRRPPAYLIALVLCACTSGEGGGATSDAATGTDGGGAGGSDGSVGAPGGGSSTGGSGGGGPSGTGGASGPGGAAGSAGSGGVDASTGGGAGAASDAGADGGSDGGADAASGAGGDAGSDGGTGATGDAGGDAGGGGSEDGGGSCTKCTTYGAASASTNLGIAAVTELSGLAASHAHPGVFYAHNDSGDSARFFAFALDGAELGTFNVQGLAARDWEDVDIGPCPTGTCLFFADFGDNAVARTDCRIIRVAEPSVSVGSPVGTVSVTYDRFDFTYPDGSHNAETLLVHPRTGDLYVVTKQSGTSQVFRMPSPGAPGASQVLTAVGTLPLGGTTLATGGSIHPCGDRFLLRTYGTLLEYVATGPFETAFTVAPRSVPVAGEPQGEAVTYLADGRGYLTVSEGASPALNLASCQ